MKFKYLKLLGIVLVSLFVVLETVFLLLPRFLNTETYKKQICKYVSEQLKEDFSYEDASIKTYPDFSVKLVLKNTSVGGIVDVKNIETKIGLTRIIFKKIFLKTLYIDEPVLTIKRYKDNTTNLDYILSQPMPVDVLFKKSDVKINNYKVFFDDEIVNKKSEVNGKILSALVKKKELNFKIHSNLLNGKEKALVNLDILMPRPNKKTWFQKTDKYFLITGSIKNLKPEFFKEYLKIYFDKNITDITGVINADFIPQFTEKNDLKSLDAQIIIDNFKIISKIRENSIIFDKNSKINIKVNFDKKNLIIENCEFLSDRINASIKGSIKNFRSKKAKPDVSIEVKNSKSDAFYWMFPSNLFTDNQEIKKLKGYGFYSDVNANIRVSGNATKPDVDGFLNFENVWILDGLGDTPKATIKTGFEKTTLNVDVKVPATKNECVYVVGHSDLYVTDKNYYHITSTSKVPLKAVRKVLPPIADVINFEIGPVPFLDIVGIGNIDLITSGDKYKPSLIGVFNFIDTTAGFEGYKAYLTATGSVDFKKDKIYFHTNKATMFGQKASLSGVTDMSWNMEYSAKVNHAPLQGLIDIVKTSPALKNESRQLDPIKSLNGYADIDLKLKGKIPTTFDKNEIIKNVHPSGNIKLYNGEFILKEPSIIISDINGLVNFDFLNFDINLSSKIYNSPLKIAGKIKSDFADIKINSSKMKLSDTFKLIYNTGFMKTDNKEVSQSKTIYKLNAQYKGHTKKIDFNKLVADVEFPNQTSSVALIDVLSGKINIKNGNIYFDNINMKFFNTKAFINGTVKHYMKKPLMNVCFEANKIDLKLLNNSKTVGLLPQKYQKLIKAYKNYDGFVTANMQIKNNNINGKIWLRDINFKHKILSYPFSVKSADFVFKDNNLDIKSFSASFAGTPLFLYGNIDDMFKNPKYDINIASKISKDFIDNYINTNLSYPILVKGEVIFSSQIKGKNNVVTVKPSLKLEEGANVSYRGASLADENSIRELNAEIIKYSDKIQIKNLDFSKYIYNQNNRLYPLNLVKIEATVSNLKKKPYVENAYIKTNNPISAKFFNILFKKSLIKAGLVNCDLKLNGYIDSLKALGNFNVKNVEIPIYNTTIDEVNANFKDDEIDLLSNINYLNAVLKIDAKLKNQNLNNIYFKDINVNAKNLNLNDLLKYMEDISYSRPVQVLAKNHIQENLPFDIKNITIDKGHLNIEDIQLKLLKATDIKSDIKLKNNDLILHDTSLNVADGKIKGDLKYNFNNANIYTKLKFLGVDANLIATAALDIENQIYGKVDADVKLSTRGATDELRLANLTGDIYFNVDDGRMPKLGSLEYLLRAGNLVKSGITGLTINNLGGLLVPYRSGEFSTIEGYMKLNQGKADRIKISTKGKNLSLLFIGNYNFVQESANISILGKLSKKVDTILGPVGNASLNSFFNLIPGVSLDSQKDTELIQLLNSIPELAVKSNSFRYFKAKIEGDINSDNSVSLFEWIDK